jgi:hypothetical protein
MSKHSLRSVRFSFIILVSAFCLFLILAAYQLHLPGLHYDEAKEAGLNAMQLITGQPVTAFRDATVQVGPWRLPLMVQDYIGALNVVLATPFLALGGVNTVALRWLPLLTAALTLVITWRVALRLGGVAAASVAVLLLAVNPSFIFWSRQGIFVTNLTALIFMASLLAGLRWWSGRRPRDLWLMAFLWGLGVYTKLLFVWAIVAMVIVAALAWLLEARGWKLETGSWKLGPSRTTHHAPRSLRSQALTWILALVFFLIPLLPLIVFNVRTSGTLTSVFGNLGKSYYGVDNSAYLPNLLTRVKQVGTLLRGDHFWYLGEVFADAWAPWMAAFLICLALLVGLLRDQRGMGAEGQGGRGTEGLLRVFIPLLLLALMVAQSAFTVSDLFITHYALLLPLIPLAGGVAFGVVWRQDGLGMRAPARRGAGELGSRGDSQRSDSTIDAAPISARTRLSPSVSSRPYTPTPPLLRILVAVLALIAVLIWAGGDLRTTLSYHRLLTVSGGYGAHSDAIYALAQYLDQGGFSSPLALDWGLDAPVRFLTAGRVQPVEAFGYAPLDRPDPGFADRIRPFLDNPDVVYLAHSADRSVFRGRAEALATLAAEKGLTVRVEAVFGERSSRQLFVVYRVVK